MNTRLFIYAFIIATFFACGEKEKKADENSNKTLKTSESKTEEATLNTSKEVTIDTKIATIKANFSEVEKLVPALDKKTAVEEFGGGSTEFEGYFNPEIPVKVKSSEMGGHGSVVTSYYFKDNTLFFVFEQEYSEASVNGPFTSKEKRYYIYDGELIRVLEKEKTVKSGTIDMSTIQNVDVTEQWKSKLNVVSNLKKAAREASSKLLSAKTVGLDNGRWISTDDPKSGVEIKDGQFIMFYKGTETKANSIFNYELYEEDGVEYLRLKNDSEEMVYGLLEYSDETMVLSYLGRGNTLTYRKEN